MKAQLFTVQAKSMQRFSSSALRFNIEREMRKHTQNPFGIGLVVSVPSNMLLVPVSGGGSIGKSFEYTMLDANDDSYLGDVIASCLVVEIVYPNDFPVEPIVCLNAVIQTYGIPALDWEAKLVARYELERQDI